jgi:hypothetical protein
MMMPKQINNPNTSPGELSLLDVLGFAAIADKTSIFENIGDKWRRPVAKNRAAFAFCGEGCC